MTKLRALRLNAMANRIVTRDDDSVPHRLLLHSEHWEPEILNLDDATAWHKLQVGKYYDYQYEGKNGNLEWGLPARLSAVDPEKRTLTLSKP